MKEALAARKAAGVRLGRKPGAGKSRLDKYRPEIEALLRNGSRKNFIAKVLRGDGMGSVRVDDNSNFSFFLALQYLRFVDR